MPSRVLAFLFTDLVGSTELLAALGDAAGEEMLRAHFRGLRDEIAATGGREVKSLGDGLMAVFESPSDAVICAIAMQRSVDVHNRRRGTSLAMRVGIQVGEATEGDEAEPDYFGSPVVQAKRLCDAAAGGQILASELVRALIDPRSVHQFHSAGRVQLKGWPEPIPAVEVVWTHLAREQLALPPVLARRRADASPFVGRVLQRDVLQRIWADAEGKCRVALISGEPGVGKTRLAEQFALDTHVDGATVLWGRSAEENLVPYEPFIQALGHYVATCPLDQLREEVGSSGPDLLRVVPALGQRMPWLVSRIAEDSESERAELFEAISLVLFRLTAPAPALLVLDDLQWADQGTLLLLRHLARSSDPPSLLIVATYRDTEVSRTHPLAVALADLRRESSFDRVELAGLAPEDVAALLRALLGHDPGEELTRSLVAETQGNPFFLEEMVRHLREAGALGRNHAGDSAGSGGLPDSVKDVIVRRLQRLSPRAQEAISTAAVLGSEFDLPILSRLVGGDAPSVVTSLDEGVLARLIVELPDRVGRYGFPHALVRQALYEERSATSRAMLHREAGAAIEELYDADLDPHLPDLARHFSLAGEEEVEKVIRYGQAAGERALGLLAYEDAARELSRALAALARTEGDILAARAELLVLLGTALMRAGDHAGAREAFAQAVSDASAVSAGDTLARAALGYGSGAGFGGIWISFGVIDEQLVASLERALAAADVDGALRVRLLGRLAQALYWAHDSERIRSLSAEALAEARRLRDPTAIAYALDSRHVALWGPDHLEERMAVAEEMLRLGRDLGDRDIQLEAYAWLITNTLETGPMDVVDRYIEGHARVADELRQPAHLWYTFVVRAMRAFMQGRYAETQRLTAEAWRYGEHAHPENALQVNQLLTLLVLLEMDELGGLIDPLVAYVEASPLAAWHSALAMAYAEAGMLREAEAEIGIFASRGFDAIPRDCIWFATLAMLTRALARIDAPDWSRQLYELLLPFEERNCVVGGAVLSFGPVAGLLGVLAGKAGDHRRALEHLEDAAQRSRTLGSEPVAARAELAAARVLVERGGQDDTERARELLERACDTAQRTGMPRLIREVGEVREGL